MYVQLRITLVPLGKHTIQFRGRLNGLRGEIQIYKVRSRAMDGVQFKPQDLKITWVTKDGIETLMRK